MVKTPRTRHSKTRREPLTIELDEGAVSRIDEERAERTEGESAPASFDIDEPVAGALADEPDPTTDAPPQDDKPMAMDEDVPAREGLSGYTFEQEPSQAAPRSPDRPAFVPGTASTGRDGFSRIAAGLIGALAALIVAAILQYAGLLGTPGGNGNSAAIQSEIDALSEQVQAIGQSGADPGIEGKVDGFTTALETVTADVAALKQSVAAGTGGDAAGLTAIETRLKVMEDVVTKIGQDGAGVAAGDAAGLAERLGALEATVKTAGDAAASTDGRVGKLEQSVAALAAKVDAQAAQPKIALAIATAALKSAIERGAPFSAELETLAAIAPDAPEVQTLRAFAEKGVPTREALVADMDSAGAAMIAASEPVDQNAGFFDRLLHSAEQLVTVRPIGAVEGTGVPAIVARMEVALKAGKLDAAVKEFDTLPDAVKAAGSAFAVRLKARQEVEAMVDQAIAAAMKA